ncbi:MAG: MoxR family ATPase [Acidimicrobiia bacterium]|nr:MoxR family ATPase [Acidimicrobiia bacterium]
MGAALLDNLGRVVRGKGEALHLALVAVLSGGHLLIEDVPGQGKTLLAKALARSIGGSFRRVQATPDLLPSELTGVSIYSSGTGAWEFRSGPLFANVVLVDEVNRTTPRTQSALLEAMEERQVSVDGTTHPLPDPFFLVATQNPFEHAGTFPLVEGQRDRFALVLELGHPPRLAERELLLGTGGTDELEHLRPVIDPPLLAEAIRVVHAVHCAPAVADYIVEIGARTRSAPDVRLGASPRAALGLLNAAKARAAMQGRHYVLPDDVKALAPCVLAHRLLLTGGPDLSASAALVRSVLEDVPVPRDRSVVGDASG